MNQHKTAYSPDVHPDRRVGRDRRLVDSRSPVNYERRLSVEPRQPEVRELNLSAEEMLALGFPLKPTLHR